ncbi:hypothetical protein HWV62_21942 [Athelia sp. TMB]|nr:hypothetical protein HWV62_21942 [Athelia sp. TMB]
MITDARLCTSAFFRVVDNALISAKGIENLELGMMEECMQHLDALSAAHFPRLRFLRVSGAMGENLARFIRNHSGNLLYLNYMHLNPRLPLESLSSHPNLSLPAVPEDLGVFPELMGYDGDGQLLPLVVPGSHIDSIDVYFMGEVAVKQYISTLHTTHAPWIRCISLLTVDWCPEALASIAQQAPSLTQLQWKCILPDDHEALDWTSSEEILCVLLQLPDLEEFHMKFESVPFGAESVEEFMQDCEILEQWSKALPNLTQLQLPWIGMTYRLQKRKWIPVCSDDNTLSCIFDHDPDELLDLPWLEAFAHDLAKWFRLPDPYHLQLRDDFLKEMQRVLDELMGKDPTKWTEIHYASLFLSRLHRALTGPPQDTDQ